MNKTAVLAKNTSPLDQLVEEYALRTKKLEQQVQALKAKLSHYRKLQGEMSDSLNEILTIQKVSEIITEHLDYDKIALSLIELCARVVRFTAARLDVCFDDAWKGICGNADDMEACAGGSPVAEDFDLLRKNLLEEGIVDWIWKQNRAIVVPLKELLVHDQLRLKEDNLIVSPLCISGKGLGILMLLTDKKQEDFLQKDLQLVQILSLQAAIAIQYTRMYKNLEKTHTDLENSQANLLRAIKLATVGEIAGGVAHEINNPLQIILGKIQIARMDTVSKETLEVLEMQAMRIATIVRGLLTLAQRGNDKRSDFIDIKSIVESTLGLIRSQFEKRGVRITLAIDANIPGSWGNSVYLQQILLNFLMNAKKRVSAGGEVKILARSPEKTTIQIVIGDSGPAIPEVVIANVRDPFSTISSSQETDAHFGLVISAQMMREIGGDIEIGTDQEFCNKVTILIPVRSRESAGGGGWPTV